MSAEHVTKEGSLFSRIKVAVAALDFVSSQGADPLVENKSIDLQCATSIAIWKLDQAAVWYIHVPAADSAV